MKVIRYSKGFKLQLVQEVESGKSSVVGVERKYGLRGAGTLMRWVRQYGSGKYGKVIRVEKAGEVDEASRLRKQLRRVKEALADAHVELALETAYLEVACEQLNQTAESFKKSRLVGGAPGGRGQPGVEGAARLPCGPDDPAKLLCAPKRVVSAGSGCGFGPGVGPGAKRASAALGGEEALRPAPGGVKGGGSEDGPGPAL